MFTVTTSWYPNPLKYSKMTFFLFFVGALAMLSEPTYYLSKPRASASVYTSQHQHQINKKHTQLSFSFSLFSLPTSFFFLKKNGNNRK